MLVWRIAVQQACFTIKKTCTRKANWEEAMPAGWKKDEKDEKDECLDEYFGTLRTPWLVMNKSTYLENIVLHLLNISTWTWVSASSTVKGTEAVSRRSDKARVNTKMFLIIIIINQDILRRSSHKDNSSFGHWSVTPNPSPSKSPEVFFWYLINDKTLVLEHSHFSETINCPQRQTWPGNSYC